MFREMITRHSQSFNVLTMYNAYPLGGDPLQLNYSANGHVPRCSFPGIISAIGQHIPEPTPITTMSSWLSSTTVLVFAGLFAYLAIVRALRWQRYSEIHRKFDHKINNLSFEEAQHIFNLLGMYEMPFIITYSLSLALFKTYAIPSISGLLDKTKEFSSRELCSRRYADTEILIATMMNCPVSGRRVQEIPIRIDERTDGEPEFDPRAMIVIARTNFIHSHYKIPNDDYIYTLSVFVIEPITWAKKYGWRPMSPLECQASFIYWKRIGELMNIRDIPETLDDLFAWVKEYEENCQRPAESNKQVANNTLEELLRALPEAYGVKNLFRRLVVCVLEVPVADAMLQARQPWYLHALVQATLKSIGFFMLHFLLPRATSNPVSVITLPMPKGEYMRPYRFASIPWYKPVRSGLGWFVDRLAVAIGLYHDMPGSVYKSEGYRLESVGPVCFENSGQEKVMQNAEKLLGCPITGVLSLQHMNKKD